ncbi:hypothetical protein HH195_11880 (plasmid) [Sarcina sp. JB2]|uniref:Uncharacterized protein n=1 Tax=Candidatus Sarcina troglodytae TaxID=2726954 RepID=A0ACD1BGI3_9CLOT|nr:hypothetical protein [Sarcina sp. JB2]QPJ86666.1 hypothetical protein HH195_11880 [Sarcina sp. JB2]
MINYKTKLKANELQVIEHISYNSKTQLTLQSIYSYIVKHTTLNNGSFPKPLIDLYKMYIRYHNKISCIYFRKLIKKLVDYKMVIVNKHRNTNVYSVNRSIKLFSIIPKVSQKVSQKVSSSKIAETVGTSTLQSTVQDTELKLELNNTITIIDNTVVPTEIKSKSEKSSAYEKAIEENNKDLVKPIELIKAAIDKLKKQGRYSKKIITRLETKLAKRNNINRKNMDKYLDVVVADAIAFYEVGREKMALLIATKKAKYSSAYNLKKNKSNIAIANFTQRKYDYDKLEKQLLGWDNSEDDCEIGVIKSVQIPDTANFTQRKYDYNKLEMQLLGWDNFND